MLTSVNTCQHMRTKANTLVTVTVAVTYLLYIRLGYQGRYKIYRGELSTYEKMNRSRGKYE